jgi:hypothetical protein
VTKDDEVVVAEAGWREVMVTIGRVKESKEENTSIPIYIYGPG